MRLLLPCFLIVCWFAVQCPAVGGDWTEREINESGIRARLFVHEGAPRPAILMLGGSEGGFDGARPMAARAADWGYNVMVYAYFGLPGIRPELMKVPLEEFAHALDWLHHQPCVSACPVAILGCSKGAEAALLVASIRRDVKAVIAYAPTAYVWECIDEGSGASVSSWTKEGADIPFIPYKRMASSEVAARQLWDTRAKTEVLPWQKAPDDVDSNWGWDCLRDLHVASFAAAPAEVVERAFIPVERIGAPVLLLSGGRDMVWQSVAFASAIEERLKKRSKSLVSKSVVYADAGHSFINGSASNGGTETANELAKRDSDRQLRSFLDQYLPIVTAK